MAPGFEESAAVVRAMLDSGLDAIVAMDAEGLILEFNRAAEVMFGYRREDVIGKPLAECIVPEASRAAHRRGLARRVESDEGPILGERVELSAMRSNGEEFPVELTITRLGLDGAPRFAGFIRDLSRVHHAEEERRKVELKMQQAQKLESLGLLASGIAHDFNNLLVGVLGHADLIAEAVELPAPEQESIEEIKNAARRASELCHQLLAYSGEGSFRVERVDLGDVLTEIIKLLQLSIPQKATLRLDLAAQLPAVEVETTQIRQVMMNLISNASEALGSSGGEISISTGTAHCDAHYFQHTLPSHGPMEGQYAFFEVSDNGCGMDLETCRKIFDPFFTTKAGGRGLGLAAVLGIVRGHNGALKVYSEPGHGTSFKVLIPCADQPAAAAAQRLAAEEWRGSGTVLLVDDDATVRAVGKRLLEKLGFAVVTAESGRQALALFRQFSSSIHCVILDLTLRDMGGDEVMPELRRICTRVPVILSSGYNEREALARFERRQLAGFLRKPYELVDVVEQLRRITAPTDKQANRHR